MTKSNGLFVKINIFPVADPHFQVEGTPTQKVGLKNEKMDPPIVCELPNVVPSFMKSFGGYVSTKLFLRLNPSLTVPKFQV